ncbi:TrbG/VirB9 family P-type conjugative transfer protein (plasmid) [Ampullimonas aquatilis]|uniref:TrbG/VirB9 family P-type conjugative transfer protein n=1 Tax=Ampullimonas aquatilis TaxID=1341549 RepID=UPI003C714C66
MRLTNSTITKKHAYLAFMLSCHIHGHAAEIPEPSDLDPRVRYITYKRDEVAVIKVRRGSVTRIVLKDDEKIVLSASGFAADCGKETVEWCIRADVDSNQIWVKPKDGATTNNLEVKTNQRDYSFEFNVLDDAPNGRKPGEKNFAGQPMFRVIYRFPAAIPIANSLIGVNPVTNDKTSVDQRISLDKPKPRNTKYSMQVLEGGEEITPAMVFDDGTFTYFRFPANREIPSIYYISPNEEENRINFHMEGDLAVVERMGRRFVLRLGKAVVGIWNDDFDSYGVEPIHGTNVPGVNRTVK